MPEQSRHPANKYEDIVNLPGAGAYCGGFPHSLLVMHDNYVSEIIAYICRKTQIFLTPLVFNASVQGFIVGIYLTQFGLKKLE